MLIKARVHLIATKAWLRVGAVSIHGCTVLQGAHLAVVGHEILVAGMENPIIIIHVLIVQGMVREDTEHWFDVVAQASAGA